MDSKAAPTHPRFGFVPNLIKKEGRIKVLDFVPRKTRPYVTKSSNRSKRSNVIVIQEVVRIDDEIAVERTLIIPKEKKKHPKLQNLLRGKTIDCTCVSNK